MLSKQPSLIPPSLSKQRSPLRIILNLFHLIICAGKLGSLEDAGKYLYRHWYNTILGFDLFYLRLGQVAYIFYGSSTQVLILIFQSERIVIGGFAHFWQPWKFRGRVSLEVCARGCRIGRRRKLKEDRKRKVEASVNSCIYNIMINYIQKVSDQEGLSHSLITSYAVSFCK